MSPSRLLIWEHRLPAPAWVIDSRDALSSHPPRCKPIEEDSIAFHKLICVAPRSCTTPVSFCMTPWGHKVCVSDLPLPSLQPHLHITLQHPHCITTVSMFNPSSQFRKFHGIHCALHFKQWFFWSCWCFRCSKGRHVYYRSSLQKQADISRQFTTDAQ